LAHRQKKGKGEKIMIDRPEYALLSLALFGIAALILAIVIKRRNGRSSSVLSIIPNEPAKKSGRNQSSPTSVLMRAGEKKTLPRALVALLVMSAVSFPVVAGQNQKSLDDKENPLLIGQRNINKRQINFHSVEKEIALGRQLANEIDQQLKMVEDPVITEYVNRIGQNLVLHSDAQVPFTIKVIDTDEINAFALPGGFFYVNQGLILAAENESELAGVMAHEIAHVAARHGMEQYSKAQLVQWGTIPLIFIGGLPGYAAQNAAGVALPLTFLKFSRNAEAEADMLGAQYAWAAGYDPNGMITFFEKLQGQKRQTSSVFSTHPATGDRIDHVRQLIPRFPERDEYVVSSSDFSLTQDRLAVLSGRQRLLEAKAETSGPSRPTLRRRDPSSEPDPSGRESNDQADAQESKQPPQLRRRNPGGTP
jgi:predicted Zn-dependent protease